MQSVSSRVWTHVAVSISNDDNILHHGHPTHNIEITEDTVIVE